jgi:hypothetical protein
MVVFKGSSIASGKILAAQGAVQSFLEENDNNKAIYISLSNKSGSSFMNSITNKSQLSVITSDHSNTNEVEQFLTPIIGLKLIEELISQGSQNLLIVLDDVMQHHFMEKAVFEKANQPFSPVNIINELYQRSGIFDQYEMTTLVMLDNANVGEQFLID